MGRDKDGQITNHIKMARTIADAKQIAECPTSRKKKNWVSYAFEFVEKKSQQEIFRGEISKLKTNRNKQNPRYCENGSSKKNTPKINFASLISDKELNKVGKATACKR